MTQEQHDRRMSLRTTEGIKAKPSYDMGGTWYDYNVQAWVKDGKYVRCGHPKAMMCGCYGRLHQGKIAPSKPTDR